MRNGTWAAAIVGLVGSLAGWAQAQTFSDGQFAPGTWSVQTTLGGGGVATFNGAQPAGGNPGAHARLTASIPSFFDGAAVDYISAFTYDPSLSGAVTSIDLSLDVAQFTADAVSFQYGVIQGLQLYGANTFASNGTPGAWATTANTGLVAANFDDGFGGNPDFSATGAPFQFYFSIFETNLLGPTSFDGGADNFAATIVPEPGMLALAWLGLAALAARRQRR